MAGLVAELIATPQSVQLPEGSHTDQNDWRDAKASRVTAVPRDEERLTRDDITTTVHYLRFPFDAAQRELLATSPARLVVDHPEYKVWVELTDEQRAELAGDFAD